MDKVYELKEYKMLADYLHLISKDLTFIKEILNALSNKEEVEKLKDYMEQNPELVPAEVYDFLIEITAGRFQKEFSAPRYLKKEYLQKPNKESLVTMLKKLEMHKLYLLAEWNLTEEECDIIKNAKTGDTVHIATHINPVLFTSEDEETIVVCAYTSKLEIAKEQYEKFAIQQVSLKYIYSIIKVLTANIGKKVVLVLDYDSEDFVEIPDTFIISDFLQEEK